jgi:hypothetical protein
MVFLVMHLFELTPESVAALKCRSGNGSCHHCIFTRELLEDHSPEEVVRALTTGKKTEPTAEDVSVLVSTALYSAAHEYRDSLMFIREKALGSTSIAADLVLAYSSTSDF